MATLWLHYYLQVLCGDGRHGTGHGVGHFLNVHEGPQGIGTRIAFNETHLKAGMILSNGTLSLICIGGCFSRAHCH
jgi:Xaa-Pro aminopeptidase